MKQSFVGILVIAISFLGCNGGKKADSPSVNSVDDKNEMLYDFVQTKDNSFCNPDSTIPGDCDGGSIFLTSKGNVIFIFYCMGADTDKYKIGNYSILGGDVICNFDRSYSVHVDPMNANSKEVLNNGSMKSIKAYTLKLKKLECKKYDFGFISPEQEKFVLYKTDKDHSDSFKKTCAEIKLLSDL